MTSLAVTVGWEWARESPQGWLQDAWGSVGLDEVGALALGTTEGLDLGQSRDRATP